MEKTLEQLIQEHVKKTYEMEQLEKHLIETVRPGAILKLQSPLVNNFKNRLDLDLTEEDFTCAVVVSVPGHGFSLMDVEGNLLAVLREAHNHNHDHENPEDEEDSQEDFCGLWHSDPVSLIRNFPGMIVGHVSDQMTRLTRGKR